MSRRPKHQFSSQPEEPISRPGDAAVPGRDAAPRLASLWRWARLDGAPLLGLTCVLLTAATVAAFWPATRFAFVNLDDPQYVGAHPPVEAGMSWAAVKWAFLNPVSFNWHPLTVLSHLLAGQVFGLNPWGHHLINVVLHALNAALVFLLLRLTTGAVWRSLLVATLFAVHPLRVESVAWVAERKDVLSTFFGLLALIFYVRHARKAESRKQNVEIPAARSEGHGRTFQVPRGNTEHATCTVAVPSRLTFHVSSCYLLSLCFFALGLMSKPTVVTMPFVLLLLDYWPLRRFQRKALVPLLLEKIPFFVLALAASVVTFLVQERTGSVIAMGDLPLGARAGNALISYCRYLGKLFWPTNLAVLYPHPGQWPLHQVLLAGGLLLGISGLLFAQRQRYPFVLMGWLWFLGTLVPMIGLVQTGGQAMADRHTYFPCLGILILTVWGAYELARGWYYGVLGVSLAGAIAALLCVASARQQLTYWSDGETLFRHALDVTGSNPIAHNDLGNALAEKGQMDEAIREYQEAIRLAPGSALMHRNLGLALARKGDADGAIRQYQEALRLKPDDADTHNSLGVALAGQGECGEAIRQYELALSKEPNRAETHHNLGMALAQTGQWAEAIAHYQQSLAIQPTAIESENNLAWVLATCPQAALRNGNKAVELAQNVDRLSGGKHADYLDTLAAAYAEAGQFPQAVHAAERALALATTRANAQANEIRARLKLYQKGSPYHEPPAGRNLKR